MHNDYFFLRIPPRGLDARAAFAPWATFGGPGPGGFRRRGGGGGRARRGDVRAAILALLQERPMHGYEIITELASRTADVWRPSPGSVYPTLQLLEDEGLVNSVESAGKRRFSLTAEGPLRRQPSDRERPPGKSSPTVRSPRPHDSARRPSSSPRRLDRSLTPAPPPSGDRSPRSSARRADDCTHCWLKTPPRTEPPSGSYVAGTVIRPVEHGLFTTARSLRPVHYGLLSTACSVRVV